MFDVFAPPPAKEKPSMTNLTIRVPSDLKSEFEELCAKHNTNMTQVLKNFMQIQLIQESNKVKEPK